MATKSYSRTRTLVECALMIAVGTVLAQIKIFEMPFGGSVTLVSMLPFILVSFRHGVKWGLATGFVNSLLQMLLGFYAPSRRHCGRVCGRRFCWTTCWLSPCWAWRALFAKPFKNHLLGVAAGTAACVRHPLFVQLFVRRASVGQLPGTATKWARGMSVWPVQLYL